MFQIKNDNPLRKSSSHFWKKNRGNFSAPNANHCRQAAMYDTSIPGATLLSVWSGFRPLPGKILKKVLSGGRIFTLAMAELALKDVWGMGFEDFGNLL